MVVMACQAKREKLKISLAHLRDTHDGFCDLLSHCLGVSFKTGREVFRKVRSKKAPVGVSAGVQLLSRRLVWK